MRKKGISRLLAMIIVFSMVIGGNFQGAVAGNVSYGAEFYDGGEITDGAADPAVLTEEQGEDEPTELTEEQSKDEPEEVVLPEESTGESTDEEDGNNKNQAETPEGDEPQFQDVTESQNLMIMLQILLQKIWKLRMWKKKMQKQICWGARIFSL